MKRKEIKKNEVLRKQILKRDNYECRVCGIRHKERVYINSIGDYVECDDLVETWAKNNNKKVFTVGLELFALNPLQEEYDINEIVSICKQCKLKYKAKFEKELRKEYKRIIKATSPYRLPKANVPTTQKSIMLRQHFRDLYHIELRTKTIKFINKMYN